jgi:hypothetical protein
VRWPSMRRNGSMIAAALICAVIGLSAACATSPSPTSAPPGPGNAAGGGGGTNARSGPAAGGASGVVDACPRRASP